MEIVRDNHSESVIHILIKNSKNLLADISDHRYHLLFISIASLSLPFHVYILDPIQELYAIAIMYLDISRVHEIISSVEITNNLSINRILVLDIFMVIQNPHLIESCPLYMKPIMIRTSYNPHIQELNPLTKISDAIVKIPNPHTAHIYAHSQYLNIKGIDTKEVGISCVLIITEANKNNLDRCLTCYYDQVHSNRELIIVASTSLRSFLKDRNLSIIWHDGSYATMRNRGIQECKLDYILRWNFGDWYHYSLLSILSDSTMNASIDFVSLGSITGYDGNQLVTSYDRFTGWEDIIMVKRDKILPYPDETTSDILHLSSQRDYCESHKVLESPYSCLYIKMNHKSHALDSDVPIELDRYYNNEVFNPIPIISIETSIPLTFNPVLEYLYNLYSYFTTNK